MAADAPFKVVVAIDDSQQAMEALQFYVTHHYKPTHQLVLAHCIEIPFEASQMVRAEVLQVIFDKAKQTAAATEEKYKNYLAEKHVAYKLVSEFGKPGEFLVEVAKHQEACMFVMGTRGMGTIRRTIMGSVSDYVLHHAHCPVLIFRPT